MSEPRVSSLMWGAPQEGASDPPARDSRLRARLAALPKTSIRDGSPTGRFVVDWLDLQALLATPEAAPEEGRPEWDQLVDAAKERVRDEDAARYVDLRHAVELADTRTGVVFEKDGMVEVYSLRASDWNRVVAVARGHMSQKTRQSLDRFRDRTFRAATPTPTTEEPTDE